jgi:hypothetical protein
MGYGPMTGRGAGYCVGYAVPNPGQIGGFGRGRGMGGGFGRGRGFQAGRMLYAQPAVPVPMDPASEELILKQEIAGLKNELELMESRLSNLKESEK